MNKPADPVPERIEGLQDELRWDELFNRTQSQSGAAARRAKQEIAAGRSLPMDYDQL